MIVDPNSLAGQHARRDIPGLVNQEGGVFMSESREIAADFGSDHEHRIGFNVESNSGCVKFFVRRGIDGVFFQSYYYVYCEVPLGDASDLDAIADALEKVMATRQGQTIALSSGVVVLFSPCADNDKKVIRICLQSRDSESGILSANDVAQVNAVFRAVSLSAQKRRIAKPPWPMT